MSTRPSRAQLEVAWRTGGTHALAALLRAAGWETCSCPLCGPPTRQSRLAHRAWKANLLAAGLDSHTPQHGPEPCPLCKGTRLLRLSKGWEPVNDRVFPVTAHHRRASRLTRGRSPS